jgi:hypothetical protein
LQSESSRRRKYNPGSDSCKLIIGIPSERVTGLGLREVSKDLRNWIAVDISGYFLQIKAIAFSIPTIDNKEVVRAFLDGPRPGSAIYFVFRTFCIAQIKVTSIDVTPALVWSAKVVRAVLKRN